MLSIRRATADDVPTVLGFIHELAEYEKLTPMVVATEAALRRDGFTPGSEPKFQVLIAEWSGKPVGHAFYFFNYSTFRGKPGLFLEDLYVQPAMRGKGIGKALLAALARIAVAEDCYGMKWDVLDWNTPAIDFYKSLGAEMLDDWVPVRLTGEPLERLAKSA